MTLKVMFAAGGTGGHINPGIAIAESLKAKQNASALFVGVGREAEKEVLTGADVQYEVLPFVAVTGKGAGGLLRLAGAVPAALWRGIGIVRRFNPDVVVGCGGYPSVMPVLCARLLGKPVLLLEQNVQIGKATRFLSQFAERIYAVPGAKGFAKPRVVQHVPNPVRKRFSGIAPLELPKEGDPVTILIVGGSQGAKSLNDAVAKIVKKLSAGAVSFIHQTGAADFERMKTAYSEIEGRGVELEPFLPKIWEEYSRAHLVIARAGAMTVAEIAASGRPAVFVPLAAAEGHQRANTETLESAGAAFVLEQDDQLEGALERLIDYLLSEQHKLLEMGRAAKKTSRVGGKDSADEIADWIISTARKQLNA